MMRVDWRVVAAALTALVIGLALLPGSAEARPEDGIKEGSGVMLALPGTGRSWYGAYHVGQVTAWCADLNAGPPREASGWTEYTDYTFRKQQGWGGPLQPHGNGATTASSTELAEVAWVLHHVGASPSAEIAAAVEHFVRVRTVEGTAQQQREAARWGAVTARHPGVATQYSLLEEQAGRFAGPYRLEVSWTRRPGVRNPTGELAIRLLTASGEPVPGQQVTMTSSGAMEITSPARPTDPNGSTRAWVQMPTAHDASVTGQLRVEVTGLPGTVPRLFVPAETTIQRMLAAAPATSLSWHDTVALDPTPWTPTVTTRTRDVIAEPGDEAVDVIIVTGGRPGAPFSGATTLHGPFDTLEELAAADPANTPVVGTATFAGRFDDAGDAEVHSTALEFPDVGYYTWVEALDAGPLVVPPEPPTWPQWSETSVVISPELSSELVASSSTGPHGHEFTVTDSLSLHGLPPAREVPGSDEPLAVEVSGVLLGPVTPDESGGEATCDGVRWDDAPVVSQYARVPMPEADLDGLLPASLTAPGCYSAAAHGRVLHLGEEVASFSHDPGIPSQGVLVEPPPEPEATPSPVPSPSEPPVPSPSPSPPAPLPSPSATTPEASPPATTPEASPPATTPEAYPPAPSPSAPGPTPTPVESPDTRAQTTRPPSPTTPRISSGAPIREVSWALVLAGVTVCAPALTAARSGRRRS